MLFFLATIGAVVALFLLSALSGAPYVPTHKKQANTAFTSLRRVTKKDTVLDIGSGDGVVMLAALQQGAGCVVGYEINPLLVFVTKLRLYRYIRRGRAVVQVKNFWNAAFPDTTTVVYTFGESRDIKKMYQRVQAEATRLGRKIDFISYAFEVPDETRTKQSGAHFLYTVLPLQKEKT